MSTKYVDTNNLFIAQLPGWSYNTSRDLGAYIHPGNTTSILRPTDICSVSPYLLIIICSAVANYEARTAIRNTWANKYNLDSLYNSTVKIAFLLGQSNNDTLNVSIICSFIPAFYTIISQNCSLFIVFVPFFVEFNY